MKKEKYGLFTGDERKQMNLKDLQKPEDKVSLFNDEERAQYGMAPKAKMEDNFSLSEEQKPNRFKDLLDKLSSKGAAAGKSMSAMAEPEMPEQASVEEKSFSPSDIKEAQFGEVNKIKPAEFDYESKLAVLKKLIGG